MAKSRGNSTVPPSAKAQDATTPEDNGYCPQAGTYDSCYSGDLGEQDTEFEERDAKVEATRSEFHKGIPAGDGPALSPGHDLD